MFEAQTWLVHAARHWQNIINDILIICQIYSFLMGELHLLNMFVLQALNMMLKTKNVHHIGTLLNYLCNSNTDTIKVNVKAWPVVDTPHLLWMTVQSFLRPISLSLHHMPQAQRRISCPLQTIHLPWLEI